MASPPPKRQRRSTIPLSDNDESDEEPRIPLKTSSRTNSKTKPTGDTRDALSVLKSPSKPNPTKRKSGSNITPKSSPRKTKGSTSTQSSRQPATSLHTFFSKATEEQRWKCRSESPDKLVEDGEAGDAIEDDNSSDDGHSVGIRRDSGSRPTFLDSKKPQISSSSHRPSLSSSQRFVKPAIPLSSSAPSKTASVTVRHEDHRPWSDQYGPANLDELAVNKKKVVDVQKWLTDVLSGRDPRRLLVLKGPAGAGKSTTLSLLAKSMNCTLVPWANPSALEAGLSSSIALHFEDFLNRGGAYDNLAFDDDDLPVMESQKESAGRILVVEEYPSTMTRYSHGLDAFRSVLLQYVAAGDHATAQMFKHSPQNISKKPPLVLIITETLLSSSTAATDSFTAHRLLGPELTNHPLVNMIEFNPVAATFMTKALDTVVKKEARASKRRRIPGPSVLARLAEIGDFRSATNSLEFLCLRGDDQADWSGTVAAKVKRTSKDSVPLTTMERDSLELLSQREATLDMFHATGKVVYNKRQDPAISNPEADPAPHPPEHLQHLHKPKISQVDTEALLNETGTDIQTFLSILHENYVLSCNGHSFSISLEECADFLSDSDILNPTSRSITRSGRGYTSRGRENFQSGGTEMLRQDEISFHVATRGLLFALPYPVNRAPHPGGRKGDSFKMFYPASLRLWKPTEETEALIDLYAGAIPEGKTGTPTGQGAEGVASWHARVNKSSSMSTTTSNVPSQARQYVFRDELILQTLPYLATIQRTDRSTGRTDPTLDKITRFDGLRILETAEEEPFDEEVAVPQRDMTPAATPTTMQSGSNKVADALSRFTQAHDGQVQPFASESSGLLLAVAEKLYISDDDIVDD